MNIFVGNLNYGLKEEELAQLFSKYGEVSSAKIIKDKMTGRSKGFGFIEMPDDSQANAAIQELNGSDVKGRELKATQALPPKQKENSY